MLIPLIYLISGWRWALFTSDVPLLGKTDERERKREREMERGNGEDEWEWTGIRKQNKRHRRRIAEWFPGPGGGMARVRCDCASWSRNEVRCGWTFDRPPGSTSFSCLWSRAARPGESAQAAARNNVCLSACLFLWLTGWLANSALDSLPNWRTEWMRVKTSPNTSEGTVAHASNQIHFPFTSILGKGRGENKTFSSSGKAEPHFGFAWSSTSGNTDLQSHSLNQ